MQEFSAKELHNYLRTTDVNPQLVDVREPWEFEKASLPQSILIPVAQIPKRINELNPEIETVVICHHGIRSRMVCRFLEQQHFHRVINLHGGIDAWSKEVDQSIPIY